MSTVKNGENYESENIHFQCLDEVAARYEIKDELWAKASRNIRRPTISELRRIAKAPSVSIGRSCTIEKISALYEGLYSLIGGDKLKKEMERCLEKEHDQNTRLVMLALGLSHSNKQSKDLIENTMRMVLKIEDKS